MSTDAPATLRGTRLRRALAALRGTRSRLALAVLTRSRFAVAALGGTRSGPTLVALRGTRSRRALAVLRGARSRLALAVLARSRRALAALRRSRLGLALRGARVRLAGRPWLVDVALGGGLSLFDAVTLLGRPSAPSLAGVLLWAAQTVPLLWRRRWPRAVLAAMTCLFVLFEALDPVPGKTPGPYFLIFGVYAVARYRPARDALTATVLSLAAASAVELLAGRAEPPRLDSLNPDSVTAFAAYFAVAFALGRGRRRIEDDAGRLRDLNERLRAEQETNARQAVVAERARIAGELHDVVAHHVSAIAVQARSTEDVLADDPDLGLRGVTRIAETADTALVEMRRILGLLAVTGEGEAAEPSLAHLDRLVQAAEAVGCHVTTSLNGPAEGSANRSPGGPEDGPVDGSPGGAAGGLTDGPASSSASSPAGGAVGALSVAVQGAAYRVVREAVTNVLKHAGPAWIRIDVACGASALRVEVENGPPGGDHRPVPGSGRGLVGMRERVTAFGGTLDTGPTPGGGWLVAAAFPLDEDGR